MKKVIKYSLLTLVFVVGGLIIYGLIEPYLLDTETWDVSIPNLPEAWEGTEVAVIADFQVGMWLDNKGTVRKAVEKIIERDPAAVLILGDFVYHAARDRENAVGQAVHMVRPLVEAGIPTFAVLGNHDFSVISRENPDIEEALVSRLRQALTEAGVRVLENEAAALEMTGNPLYFVGIGSYMARHSDPETALAQVPPAAARIVMMHNPGTFPMLPADSAPLSVAGHTHGGQIAIPFLPQWSWIKYFAEGADESHAEGWIVDYGEPGNLLYINRGIGFSKLPIRFSAPPELTIFTLFREQGEVVE